MIRISELIELRPITISDHQELFDLMKVIYPSAYSHYWKDDCSWYLNKIYSEEALSRDLDELNSSYYFVYYKNTRIGIFKIILNCLYPPISPLSGLKIHRIYLDHKVQGKGIGAQLMKYSERLAANALDNFIWLDAMDTHIQAQSFYKKLGYIKTDSQELDFPLLHDEHRKMWYMHKMMS